MPPADAPPARPSRRTTPDDARAVYDAIHRAIAERRLPAGTKLPEDHLATLFGVTRARIRGVLQELARDRVVTLERNRGAFVAEPTVAEARDVFAARRVIEVALAPQVVAAADARAIQRLKAHVAREEKAEKRGDRRTELKTSHDFHLLLAEIAGNAVLTGYVDELLARSALITAVYERPDAQLCSHISHGDLIGLIEARDAAGFTAAMAAHLDEIEAELLLVERKTQPVSLDTLFGR